jgi:hypothetical protein
VIYRPKRLYNLLNGLVILLFPLLLTLPHLASGMIESHELQGLAGFWAPGILLAVAPFGFRLEVEKDHVRSYFLHFRLSDVDSLHVQVVAYGNLFRGGLGFGKGLRYRARVNGKSKAYSIGENFYGKEAIAHAKRVLESQSP